MLLQKHLGFAILVVYYREIRLQNEDIMVTLRYLDCLVVNANKSPGLGMRQLF